MRGSVGNAPATSLHAVIVGLAVMDRGADHTANDGCRGSDRDEFLRAGSPESHRGTRHVREQVASPGVWPEVRGGHSRARGVSMLCAGPERQESDA